MNEHVVVNIHKYAIYINPLGMCVLQLFLTFWKYTDTSDIWLLSWWSTFISATVPENGWLMHQQQADWPNLTLAKVA